MAGNSAPTNVVLTTPTSGNDGDLHVAWVGQRKGLCNGAKWEILYSVNSNMSSPTGPINGPSVTGTSNYSYTLDSGDGLSASTEYYVQVRQSSGCGNGESAWVTIPADSAFSKGPAVPDAPGAPTVASMGGDGFEEIDLQWSAVSGATGYKLYYGTGTGNPSGNETIVIGIGDPVTRTVTGLAQAQNYSFRLKATNATGDSAFGPKLTQATFWEDEGDIAVNSGIGNDYESNTITWVYPNTVAGTDESRLYGDTSNPPTTLISTQSGDGSKTYHHASLTPGGTYRYRIRLYPGVHNELFNPNLRPIETVTNPGAPIVTSVSFSNIGDTTATVGWNHSNALSYRYLVTTAAYNTSDYQALGYNMAANGVNTNNDEVNLTGLTQNIAYRFYIIPYQYTSNGYPVGATFGYGNNIEGAQIFTTGASLPGNITSGAVTADDENSISISWGNSSNATSYDLDYSLNNSNWSVLRDNVNTNSYNHTGLLANTLYYYRARGVNSAGNGNYVSQNTYTTPSPLSTFSYEGIAGSTYDGNVRFTLTEQLGSTRIYIYNSSGTQLTKSGDDWLDVDGFGTTTFEAEDWYLGGDELNLDNEYNESLDVGAIKFKSYSANSGQKSSFSSTILGYTLPETPSSVVANATSYDAIALSWANPAGSALSETFTIQRKLSGGTYADIATGETNTTYPDANLSQNTQYYYQIKTITSAGSSSYSSEVNATTATGPDPVTGDTLELGKLGVETGDVGSVGSEISMGTVSGGTSEVGMDQFFLGSLVAVTGDSYMFPTQTKTYEVSRQNVGSEWTEQIKSVAANFTWTISNGNGSVQTNNGYRAVVQATGGYGSSFQVRCLYSGPFNDHMTTGEKTATPKTVNIAI